DSSYNTYLIDGLPPGPIGNRGRASIEAVLRPAPVDYLYFVADGSSGHAFARTLDEHNRNVAQWRKIKNGERPPPVSPPPPKPETAGGPPPRQLRTRVQFGRPPGDNAPNERMRVKAITAQPRSTVARA